MVSVATGEVSHLKAQDLQLNDGLGPYEHVRVYVGVNDDLSGDLEYEETVYNSPCMPQYE